MLMRTGSVERDGLKSCVKSYWGLYFSYSILSYNGAAEWWLSHVLLIVIEIEGAILYRYEFTGIGLMTHQPTPQVQEPSSVGNFKNEFSLDRIQS